MDGFLKRGASFLGGAVWDLQDSANLKSALTRWFISSIVYLIAYLAVGFLTAWLVRRSGAATRAWPHPILLAIAVCTVTASLASVAAASPGIQWPNVADVVWTLPAGLIGAWIGSAVLRRRVCVTRLILVAVLGTALTSMTVTRIFSPQASTFKSTQIHSSDRVRLVKLLRDNNPAALAEGESGVLALTADDINLLLAWGLSLGSTQRKIRVGFAPNLATIRLSAYLPFEPRQLRYLNIIGKGHIRLRHGDIDLRIDSLRVGRIELPPPIRWLLESKIAAIIRREPIAAPILDGITRTEIDTNRLTVHYRRIDMPDTLRGSLFGTFGAEKAVREALTAQIKLLLAISRKADDYDDLFSVYLQTAFQLAQQRSKNSDPILQNRAAIIALGAALGHRHIGLLVEQFPDESLAQIPENLLRQVQLRGRNDWSRHFFVAAALEAISTERVSFDTSLLKEEYDADASGRGGFSFSDLAADRAGIQFAVAATQDDDSARAIQAGFLWTFAGEDVFPDVADLPDDISMTELDIEYDGVDGARYKQLLAEIDRRIADCRLFRSLDR